MKSMNLKCIDGPEGPLYIHEERGKNDKYIKVLLFGLDTYSNIGLMQDYLSSKDDDILTNESRYSIRLKCGAIIIGEYDTGDESNNYLFISEEAQRYINIRNMYEKQHCVCSHTDTTMWTDDGSMDENKLAEDKVCKTHNQKCGCNLAKKSNRGMMHQKSTQFVHKLHDAALMWIKQELYKSTSFYDCAVHTFGLKTCKFKITTKITKG
jgi:hypothetical protein